MMRKLIIKGVPVTLSEEKIEMLTKAIMSVISAIEESEKEAASAAPNCTGYYINKLAEKFGWNPRKMINFLSKMAEFSPSIPFKVLLKEIALELDSRYEGHIKDCEKVWVVSMLDGSVGEVSKEGIVNYDNFAAFRTKEDAEFAIMVLSDLYGDIFCRK